jgi:hypothetical protein
VGGEQLIMATSLGSSVAVGVTSSYCAVGPEVLHQIQNRWTEYGGRIGSGRGSAVLCCHEESLKHTASTSINQR